MFLPDKVDITSIYKHITTFTTTTCVDVLEGYATYEHSHTYLLAIKPSVNHDTPYMLPIFRMEPCQ